MLKNLVILTQFFLIFQSLSAQASIALLDCGVTQVWDLESGMCMPLAASGENTSMAMAQENAFLVGVTGQSPRMRTALASPNMVMGDLGTNFYTRHYFNVDVMATLEPLTFPASGYPELMQVGEQDNIGRPYIDNQHPHTYLMGATLSDTISLSDDGSVSLKLFAAPRGDSTDGPVAFMHRPTGMVNPDAPLGHHLGQDSGHISSSVLGFSLKLDWFRLESSTFYGAEPSPLKIDVPVAPPNSYAVRAGFEFFKEHLLLASFASVKDPEATEVDPTFITRYSASLLDSFRLSPSWTFINQIIFGTVYNYDNTVSLSSWNEEFLFKGVSPRIWGRLEYLQRTPAELAVPGGFVDYYSPRWVGEATLGYTQRLITFHEVDCGLGTSVTLDFIPGEFVPTYGSMPLTGKVFVQVNGMGMWMFD